MAITLDSSSATKVAVSGTITSNVQTCTGADGILFCGIVIRNSRTITAAPTYNGVTMTLIGSASGTTNVTVLLYYLIAPTTGSSLAVTATQSASDTYSIATVSFAGAKQTGQPDAFSTQNSTTTTSYSQSVTTVADNAWAVVWGSANAGATLTAGADTTIVNQPELGFTGAWLARGTGAKTPAGTFTLNVTSTSQVFAGVMASFSPAVAAGPANVKTWNGVTQSTGVKTYMGVAVASVKSVNGVV